MAGIRVVALAGGVGGAKLVDGLAQVLQPGYLTVIVNTADDFTYLGLRISPDLDTVCYTLAGVANPDKGWGRDNETWYVHKHLAQLGMPVWFQIGDADLATHIARTVRLTQGMALSQVTEELCNRLGINTRVLPMSNEVVQTLIISDEGEMGFQEYFVKRKWEPAVQEIRFTGVERSKPAPGVIEAIEMADAVIICPSNPWVSIDPILAVPGIRAAISGHFVLAVSPIIGEQAVKGPAAKMFKEMGIHPSAQAVAEHYDGLIDSLVIDNSDRHLEEPISALGIRPIVTATLMRGRSERSSLASEIINYLVGKGEVPQ